MGIRAALGEDHLLVREGLERALGTSGDIEVVASCADLGELEAAISEEDPDVVVTDIRMPPTLTNEGIRLATGLAESRPDTGVVVLSHCDEQDHVLALLESGTSGRAYLLKEAISHVSQLCDAVRVVAAGGSTIDPRLVERLASARLDRRSSIEWLTSREREVLEAMASGLSNRGIADALGIGLRSVEKHVSAIFAKLSLSDKDHVHRRVQAVLAFLGEMG